MVCRSVGLSVVTGVGLGDGVGVTMPSVGGAGAGVGLSGVADGLMLGLTVTTGSFSWLHAVSRPRASTAVAAAAAVRDVVAVRDPFAA